MLGHVPARRHPHQFLVAALLMLSGLPILVGGPRPGSVSAALPEVMLYVWAAVLAGGGALVVAAAVVPPLLALYFELAADLPLSVMCGVYSGAALMLSGTRALVPAAIVAGAALAFAVRAVQVARTLLLLRREMEARS